MARMLCVGTFSDEWKHSLSKHSACLGVPCVKTAIRILDAFEPQVICFDTNIDDYDRNVLKKQCEDHDLDCAFICSTDFASVKDMIETLHLYTEQDDSLYLLHGMAVGITDLFEATNKGLPVQERVCTAFC